MKYLFTFLIVAGLLVGYCRPDTNSIKLIADTNSLHFTNDSFVVTETTNVQFVHYIDSPLFALMVNITHPAYDWGIDFAHPTNVEFIFYHEPVLVSHTSGVWVYHFKD